MARSVPYCTMHHSSFKVEKNGLSLLELLDGGAPYRICWGDRWVCRTGGESILKGFGAYMYPDEEGFETFAADADYVERS